MAAFEHLAADHLLSIQAALNAGNWAPGPYVHFQVHSPKSRRISAAPFADRVVHHALCNAMTPVFEPLFHPDSYANRPGKGTHRAVDRVQFFSRCYRYVLRLDIVKHFPSIDHEVLMAILRRDSPGTRAQRTRLRLRNWESSWIYGGRNRPVRSYDRRILALAGQILAGGDRVLEQEYEMVWFPGDDLWAALRPRGLPIGNLTSQFWSNCYLNPLDHFVARELGCSAYVRYVDDMALFADSKTQLWEWKAALGKRLEQFRLTFHDHSAQVQAVEHGIPWLGFVVYPTHRRLKARKVVHASRQLAERFAAWQSGTISFGEWEASVLGWVNHAAHGDTWGIRDFVLDRYGWGPEGAAQRVEEAGKKIRGRASAANSGQQPSGQRSAGR